MQNRVAHCTSALGNLLERSVASAQWPCISAHRDNQTAWPLERCAAHTKLGIGHVVQLLAFDVPVRVVVKEHTVDASRNVGIEQMCGFLVRYGLPGNQLKDVPGAHARSGDFEPLEIRGPAGL